MLSIVKNCVTAIFEAETFVWRIYFCTLRVYIRIEIVNTTMGTVLVSYSTDLIDKEICIFEKSNKI